MRAFIIAAGTSRSILLAALLTAGSARAESLHGRVFDFCVPAVDHVCSRHPDFEPAGTGVKTGMVRAALSAEGLPVYAGQGGGTWSAGAIASEQSFDQWFRETPGINSATDIEIPLTETAPGAYEYLRSEFFPIDRQLFGNQGRLHNQHFTVHLKATIAFTAADALVLTADDDAWIFINRLLVLDLGGVHQKASQALQGADLLQDPGLSENTPYPIDIFFADRRTSTSNFSLSTTFRISPRP